MTSRIHYGVCNFCDSVCGIEIEHQGREILTIRGDSEDPFSRGHICPKGLAQEELLTDPDRLRGPVRRTADGWEPIPWETALGTVAEQLADTQRRHGAEALGFYYGNPIGHNYQALLALLAAMKSLGTRNIFGTNSVDAHPRMLTSLQLYGNQALIPIPDIERTDHLVIMGANPAITHGSAMTAPDTRRRLREIRQRGGRIVVIDPRRTETAEWADTHHFIRPGTDALLLLAVLHVFHAEGRVDFAGLARVVRGQEKLAALAERHPPERVAERVGIDADSIRRIAIDFAQARSAVWYGRMGTCTQPFGCLSSWLIDAVNLATGNVDVPGGAMFTTPAVDLAGLARLLGEPGYFGRWQSRVSGQPEFNGEFPVAVMAEEIETPGTGQIKAMLTIAGNPVLSTPNGRRLDRALEQLEFMACIDFYVNETTRHAHIILPPPAPLESDHYPILELALGVRNTAHYTPALFPPEGDTRPDWRILLELIQRMETRRGGRSVLTALGIKALSKAVGSGMVLDLLLRFGPQKTSLKALKNAPHGLDFGPLEPRLEQVLQTPDGRIDLVPELFAGDLARLEDSLEAPLDAADAAGDFPLSLISRRTMNSMNSWLNNLPSLVRGRDRCTLQMHPDDIAKLGVEQAEEVVVTSRVGEIRVPLEPSPTMMRGVVSLPYGWGHDRPGVQLSVAGAHAGASMNDVVDEALFDAVSGTSVLDGIPVAVRRPEPDC